MPEQDIVQGVQKLQEEYKALRKKVEELQEFYLTSMGKELVGKAKGSKIVEIVKGLSQQDTLKLAQLLVNANEALAVVLVSRDANFVVAMSGKMSSYNAKNAIQTMLSFVKEAVAEAKKLDKPNCRAWMGSMWR